MSRSTAASASQTPATAVSAPGEDDAEPARNERDERPASPAEWASVAEREPDQTEHERGARERREVVDADERRLPLSRALPFELGDEAEELEQAP